MKFRGEFEHSMDQKGRTAMPSAFREVLASRCNETAPRMILLRWLDPCLRLYVADDWEAEEERFESQADDLLDLDETYADVRRVIFSLATDVVPDRHGRILIKPSHRSHADLNESVIWVGQGRYIELWDPVRWRSRIEAALGDRDALRQGLRGMLRGRSDN